MRNKKSSAPDLFDASFTKDLEQHAPLADRMRPLSFEDFVGQEKIVGTGTPLRKQIELDALTSIVLWGPPGSGKTTLAKIISQATKSYFQPFSAISFSTADFRQVIQQVIERRKLTKQRTILFVDEIHRLNKAQQDQLLPYLERGIITLIGATTENPSFELNSAILSRSQVYVLDLLKKEDLKILVEKVLKDQTRGLGRFELELEDKALNRILELANGDARILYNILERAALSAPADKKIDDKFVDQLMQNIALLYDKHGEEHYNLISALHKCMRDGAADAALYWLGRMIQGGEDPMYIIRRVIRFASEDIGLADPQALVICIAAKDALHHVGLPEADTALAQAVVYCARAPKSNALYAGLGKVRADINQYGNLPVPLNIRNAPTKLMQELDYGKDYRYFHNDPRGAAAQEHLPAELKGRKYLSQ